VNISIRFDGKEYTLVYGCLEGLSDEAFQGALKWSREKTKEGSWLILLRDCCKLPDRRVIVTSLLHTLRNFSSGRMISRDLVHEFLLFLIGVRNIKDAVSFFGEGQGTRAGFVGISSRGAEPIFGLLEEIRGVFKAVEEEPDEDCWISLYSAFLNLPPDRELLVRALRARATLLALTL